MSQVDKHACMQLSIWRMYIIDAFRRDLVLEGNCNCRMSRSFVLIIGIVVGIYLSFRFLLPLVVPFLVAGIVSIMYYPFLRKIYHNCDVWTGRSKRWILVLSVVLFYVVVILVLGVTGMYLFGQCKSIWLNLPFYQVRLLAIVRDCCEQVDEVLRIENGESYAYIEGMMGTVMTTDMSGWIPRMTGYSVQLFGKVFSLVFEVIVTVMATFFLIQDYEMLRSKLLETSWGMSICKMITTCKDTLKVYVKAQGLIMLLDGLLCTLAFFAIRQPYFLVLGPLVAVLDALPILGAGILLIPYGVYLLVMGQVGKGLIILLAYLGCVVIRQMTEPKMIGNKIGMRPIYTLLSMYIGFQLFGVIGFLLGPVGVLIGKEVYGLARNALANAIQ